jgi:rubrerythrin
MNIFKCRICESPYAGNTKPSNCPFCGAPAKFIILAENWVDRQAPELSEISKRNLEQSLTMELENMAFYRCAMEAAEDPLARAMFEALLNVETKHAESVRELLGRSEGWFAEPVGACSTTSPREHLEEGLRREHEAVKFYRSAAGSAKEERVKEFFTALVEIEEDHISISNLGLGVA